MLSSVRLIPSISLPFQCPNINKVPHQSCPGHCSKCFTYLTHLIYKFALSNDQVATRFLIQVTLAIVPNVLPVILIPSISLSFPMAIPNTDYTLVVWAIVSFSFVLILHTLHCTTFIIIPTPDAYTARIALFVVVVNLFYAALPEVYSLPAEPGVMFFLWAAIFFRRYWRLKLFVGGDGGIFERCEVFLISLNVNQKKKSSTLWAIQLSPPSTFKT